MTKHAPEFDEMSVIMRGRDVATQIMARAKAVSMAPWDPKTSISDLRAAVEAEALRQMRFLVVDIEHRQPPMIDVDAAGVRIDPPSPLSLGRRPTP